MMHPWLQNNNGNLSIKWVKPVYAENINFLSQYIKNHKVRKISKFPSPRCAHMCGWIMMGEGEATRPITFEKKIVRTMIAMKLAVTGRESSCLFPRTSTIYLETKTTTEPSTVLPEYFSAKIVSHYQQWQSFLGWSHCKFKPKSYL